MKRISLTLFVFMLALAALPASSGARAQQQQSSARNPAPASAITPSQLAPAEIERIVRRMAQKETEFREALANYGFRRDATIQTIGQGGQITGEYRRVSNFVFSADGRRFERIAFFPMSTLTEIQVTTEDLEDLGGVQAFALEASKIDQYNFTYVGRERIDELNLHVFDVAPKTIPRRVQERFFQGRIWVDDQDFQIVKARGKGVPEGDQRFPTFESYREQVDGRYWFPTYTYADDELVFRNGQVVRLRMLVRFTDFQRFRSTVTITDIDDEPVPDETPAPAPSPSPTATPRRP